MVVPQHQAEQVQCLLRHQSIVLRVNEFGPRLARDGLRWEKILVVRVEDQAVLVEVGVELLGSEHLRDLDELVIVVTSLEERLTLEDHTGKHAAKRPNVQRVIVGLKINKQFGSLEVSRSDANIILLPGMVKFGQTPINQSELAVRVVDHNVVRLDIAMHDAFRVAEVERLKNLIHVEANVEVVEALVQLAEVCIASIDEFSNNGGSLGQWVPHDIDQLDNVHTAFQVLQNLDLSSNLVLLDCQE